MTPPVMGSLGGNNCLSLERLLEVAHATGELVLTCRNLKTFPKHRCKYDLKDTVTVGKTDDFVISYNCSLYCTYFYLKLSFN